MASPLNTTPQTRNNTVSSDQLEAGGSNNTGKQGVFSGFDVTDHSLHEQQSSDVPTLLQRVEKLSASVETALNLRPTTLVTSGSPAGEECATVDNESPSVATAPCPDHQERLQKLLGYFEKFEVDADFFHRTSAEALRGRQDIIKFLDCKGELSPTHNLEDPNFPSRDEPGVAFNLSEPLVNTPYYCIEFSITDCHKKELAMTVLFNIGSTAAKEGIWGEIFMQDSKVKIADIKSVGDGESEIIFNNATPQFASYEEEIFSSEITEEFRFIDFVDNGQLSKLTALAIYTFNHTLGADFDDSEGGALEAAATSALAPGSLTGKECATVDSESPSVKTCSNHQERFQKLLGHFKEVELDSDFFHKTSAEALQGRQDIIKFLGCKGEFSPIHNLEDPNFPSRDDKAHFTTYLSEPLMITPYYCIEFSITDCQKQELAMTVLFNVGSADANHGFWGEIFIRDSKVKIADIKSVGDMESEIIFNNDAPLFASYEEEIFSSDIMIELRFIEFVDNGQLSKLTALAIHTFYHSLGDEFVPSRLSCLDENSEI